MVDTSSGGEAPAGSSDGKPPPRHRYWQQVHIVFVVAMAAVVAALSVLGVVWLPQAGAYPTVPEGLTVSVYGNNVKNQVIETLEQTQGGGSVLEVAEDVPALLPTTPGENWTVIVEDLEAGSGRVCQPPGDLDPSIGGAGASGTPPTTVSLGGAFGGAVDIFEVGGVGIVSGPYTIVTGRGRVMVSFCWGSGGLDQLAGSYLSAFLPPAPSDGLDAPPGVPAIKSISRFVLVPDGSDAADYTVQAAYAPLSTSLLGEPAWEWPPSTILSPIRVTASNATTSQHEVYFSFLSGIAFGVAGGAAIAILQELLDPLSHRRDRRHRAPGTGRG